MQKIAAAISIASDGVYMNLSERHADSIKRIEYLFHPLNLGQDTFNKGKIGFGKVEKLCAILNNYRRVLKEYRVKDHRVVSTTALREARNSIYILDQIKSRTKFDVEVLDDNQEKSYIYRLMLMKLQRDNFNAKHAFLAYIGTGSLGIALYKNGRIVYSQNIRIGSLKLTELLRNFQDNSQQFHIIIKEYLSSFVQTIETIPDLRNVKHFLTCGQEIDNIVKLCGKASPKTRQKIRVKDFRELFEEIKVKTPEQLSKTYNLPEHHTEVLLPSIGIYNMLFDIVKVDPIVAVPVTLTESLLHEMLKNKGFERITQSLSESSVIEARNLGSRFLYDEQHAAQVEKFSLQIFDLLKKVHRLGKSERHLLQIGAILHDVGKFIQLKYHSKHSSNIIKETELLGLNQRELGIVASIVKYHSIRYFDFDEVEIQKLDQRDTLIISKLLAILRIADALDRAHTNKVTEIRLTLKEQEFLITAFAPKKILLEKWALDIKSEFFEDVFGLKVRIKRGDSIGLR